MSDYLKGRIMNMIGRCVLSVLNDKSQIQSMQIEMLDGELHDDAEHLQNYGFTSAPHEQAEGVVIFPGGLRSHPIVIAMDDRRYRLSGLEKGEVALYDDLGQIVHLKRDGIMIETSMDVRVKAASAYVTADSVNVTADSVNVTADSVNVTADSVNVTADSVMVDSNDIQLGGSGGAKVARVGDDVNPQTMKIVSGSDKVKAA